MTMIALKDIQKGEQIFNDFGQLPRSDLLRRYGYVTDNYRTWDVVEVNIEDVMKAASEFNKLSEKRKEDKVLLSFRDRALVEDLLTGRSSNLRQNGMYYKMAMISPAQCREYPSNLIGL